MDRRMNRKSTGNPVSSDKPALAIIPSMIHEQLHLGEKVNIELAKPFAIFRLRELFVKG